MLTIRTQSPQKGNIRYSYDVNATDPNGDTLTYSLTQAPTGMTINAANGLIAWTPSATQTGGQAVTVRVADPGGLAATQPFAISVTAANGAPQITSTPVTSATVGVAYSYDVNATDPNGDTLTYSLTQAPTGMTINAGTGLIAWTPSATQTGSQAVTVRVADPGGLSATQTFTITVGGGGNQAPQITSAPVTSATVGTAYSYDVNATDPNGDTLTYSLTQAPSGMTINASTGLIGWTPASAQTGNQAVTVRVADPGGLFVTQAFTITVGAGTIPSTTRVDLATPATYSAPAGSAVAITLNWYRIPMAANYLQFMHLVSVSGQTWSVDDHGTTSATWTSGPFSEVRTITVPVGLANGTYDIRVGLSGGSPWADLPLIMGSGVTDPGGDRRYKVGTLTVGAAGAPTITSTPVTTATVGVAYSYDVNATDPNGDTLTYSLTQAPTGMTINAANGLIAWTPSATQTGSQGVSVRVADPGGLAATQAFTINVAATGAAPTITSTPVTTATVGVAYSYDVNATDPNGDTLTYSLTQAPTGMTINAANGLIAWTPSATQTGSQGVSVRVADPGGLAATQAFTINVTTSPPSPGPMTMSCVDGPTYQCSGDAIIRTDNGIGLTRSGVQAYGRSTSDLATPNPNVIDAFGMELTSGGVAEIRALKDSNGTTSSVAMLLSNLGISWNGQTNRPQIIETFRPTAGRVLLDANGRLSFGTLPPSTDLTFYDYAYLGAGATVANYANNRYFPRSDPARCPPNSSTWCSSTETTGPQLTAGTWRTGGSGPDTLSASRFHEDGDIHGGDGIPDANGNRTYLPGGSGFGVPFPGSKGYRTVNNWSYQYGNLTSWLSKDTVQIAEWGASLEHNKNRRGVVAFGDVTNPASVPSSGTATYVGTAYGSYTSNGATDPSVFTGTARVTVNFATRAVTVEIQNTPAAVALTANPVMGAVGSDMANYLTGPAANATMTGGLSGRFFGPVVAGGSGSGPIEIGGTFTLSNSSTKAAAVAGFIARKQ